MKRITVFCGSSSGFSEIYKTKAFQLGQTLAKHNIEMVYGGACVGLMGAVADGVLKEGGKVIGVIPSFLKTKEIAHTHLTELITVNSMHERKIKMHELSDGVIALPGGYGTMDELFEMLTWGQLGLHKKPIGVYNMNNFYESLFQHIQTMVEHGFLKDINRKMLLLSDDIENLLSQMNNYKASECSKWITKENV
ncbi:MAG: Rossman fold protein, TIGR00730 family [Bacteroidetes bacterium CG2_30_32_10]|nr:MAG: Rossman fold protein, TIGR00730 family [Bacteroidetes bacterium CG2_30_32_10]